MWKNGFYIGNSEMFLGDFRRMVQGISGGHGVHDAHHGHYGASDYQPAIISQGLEHDTFQPSHGGAHPAPKGNFLQRLWHGFTNKVSTIFWDAVSLPKVIFEHLWYGGHKPHPEFQGPFLPPQGFLSGNPNDESMTMPEGPNPYLARRGFLSGDMNDESGLYNY